MVWTIVTHTLAFLAGGGVIGWFWKGAAVKKALTTIKTDIKGS